jgi:hypothetical protein
MVGESIGQQQSEGHDHQIWQQALESIQKTEQRELFVRREQPRERQRNGDRGRREPQDLQAVSPRTLENLRCLDSGDHCGA